MSGESSASGERTHKPRLLVAATSPIHCTQQLRGQLSYSKKLGFEVFLLCSPGELATLVANEEGVTLIEVEMDREINIFKDIAAFWNICLALRKLRPDVVNTGTPKAGLLVTVAAWLCRVPVRIYTLRGLRLETTSGLLRRLLTTSERIACGAASKVICISPSLCARALQLHLLPKRKTIVLHKGSSNGLDIERFRLTGERKEEGRQVRCHLGIPEDAVVIGYVGRLVRDKGLTELVGAWNSLKQKSSNLRLLVIGPFEEGDPVPPAIAQELRNDPAIHLVGHVPLGVEPFFAAMDMVALPTYREGFGNVLIEAAAMELPVVSTQIPGCVDAVVDGVTGTLVPPRDTEALADALYNYISDPELRRRHGQAGRERVERDFRQELIWEHLGNTYVSLLQEKALPLPESAPESALHHPSRQSV